MTVTSSLQSFMPNPVDCAGVISWIHVGDLHMTAAGEQNDIDLKAIVKQINALYADSICFVYLPGDIAEHGDREAYAVARHALDKLHVPWCAIVGDHDVHEKSHANFLEAMSEKTHYAFTVDKVRFLALNAFDIAHPASFAIEEEQLSWLERELQQASALDQQKIILLHCYPSDLKSGGERLQAMLRKYRVMLVEMGHTHYNEIANDGDMLYAATRSTGQIEEGPVGFSVTCVDRDVVSWKFFEPEHVPAVMITSPADHRLRIGTAGTAVKNSLRVRAKVWSSAEIHSVYALVGDRNAEMKQIAGSRVWEADLSVQDLESGLHDLTVSAVDTNGGGAEDVIRIAIGETDKPLRTFQERDQDNDIGAWPEHGLLGTQLGPNKNGRKW